MWTKGAGLGARGCVLGGSARGSHGGASLGREFERERGGRGELSERAGQSVVERAVLGRWREDHVQAMRLEKVSLQTKTGVLTREVIVAGVAQAPVFFRQRRLAFDERVAELVQNHLREAIVWVERLRGPDEERSFAIGGGEDLGRPHDGEPDGAGAADPEDVERVLIASSDRARHVAEYTRLLARVGEDGKVPAWLSR